jgi:hypothetical protein
LHVILSEQVQHDEEHEVTRHVLLDPNSRAFETLVTHHRLNRKPTYPSAINKKSFKYTRQHPFLHLPKITSRTYCQPMSNNTPLTLLDGVRQHSPRGRWRCIRIVDEHSPIRTHDPADVSRHVQGFFHIFPVKVKRKSLRLEERAPEGYKRLELRTRS